MITLVRVDNRLIHGQVVEAWLPFLKVQRIVVADDESARSPLVRAAMALAVQGDIHVDILPLKDADFSAIAEDGDKTLVLIRDVFGVEDALKRGLKTPKVNLGNVHFGTGRKAVSPSVFLTPEELGSLEQMAQQGIEVEARAIPAEKALTLPEIIERVRK